MDHNLSIILALFLSFTLFHLLLTVALIRQVNAISAVFHKQPELPIGLLAPNFEAETLLGEHVSLASYAGRSVLFVFIHPHCQACTSKIPVIERLAPIARRADNIHFVLVIEDKNTLAQSLVDKMGITLPVIFAPRYKSEFVSDYNPDGIYPYYCLIDEKGIVQSRAPLGLGDWPEMQRKWEAMSTPQPTRVLINQYR